jgi:hypothetical protein
VKSIYSIVKKLSLREASFFERLYLSRQKSGKNKKRELFNAVLKSKEPADFEKFVRKQEYSRQNLHQLSKRLREDLYAFLFSIHNIKKEDHIFSEVMECHRKMYGVKILMDRGLNDQAEQELDEIINTSEKNELPDIYFEAVNLKSIYFPLSVDQDEHSKASEFIKSMNESFKINDYIKHYLIVTVIENHESDSHIRLSLIDYTKQHNLFKGNKIISHFLKLNKMFYLREFDRAYLYIKKWITLAYSRHQHSNLLMQGLLYLELGKVCICTERYKEGVESLNKAAEHLQHIGIWLTVIYELRYIIALRTSNHQEQLHALEKLGELNRSFHRQAYQIKLNLLKAWHFYYKKDFMEVIKIANLKNSNIQNGQKEQRLNKLLELMSIYQLHDPDWFYYKSESMRKQLNGNIYISPRLKMLFFLLRRHIKRNNLEIIIEKLDRLEHNTPWHPLSLEVLNLADLIRHMISSSYQHTRSINN